MSEVSLCQILKGANHSNVAHIFYLQLLPPCNSCTIAQGIQQVLNVLILTQGVGLRLHPIPPFNEKGDLYQKCVERAKEFGRQPSQPWPISTCPWEPRIKERKKSMRTHFVEVPCRNSQVVEKIPLAAVITYISIIFRDQLFRTIPPRVPCECLATNSMLSWLSL